MGAHLKGPNGEARGREVQSWWLKALQACCWRKRKHRALGWLVEQTHAQEPHTLTQRAQTRPRTTTSSDPVNASTVWHQTSVHVSRGCLPHTCFPSCHVDPHAVWSMDMDTGMHDSGQPSEPPHSPHSDSRRSQLGANGVMLSSPSRLSVKSRATTMPAAAPHPASWHSVKSQLCALR